MPSQAAEGSDLISESGCRIGSLAKMILAGTFVVPFCSQATVRQVRLQLTSLDRRTHCYSSLGSGRAAFVSFAALPATTSPVHRLQLLLATYL